MSTETRAPHTPGPWKVDGRAGIYQFDIVGPKGEDIGHANQSDGADEPTVYPAAENARLMAAAPDLLEALRDLVGTAQGGDDDAPCHKGLCSRQRCFQCQRVDAAYAAIRKAEGR